MRRETITYLDKLPESLVGLHELLVVLAGVELRAAKLPIGLQQFLAVRRLRLAGAGASSLASCGRRGGAGWLEAKLVQQKSAKRPDEAQEGPLGPQVGWRAAVEQAQLEVREKQLVRRDEILEGGKQALQIDQVAAVAWLRIWRHRRRRRLATCAAAERDEIARD